MKTQKQLFYQEQRKIGERDRAVIDMINDPINPLTKEDLHKTADKFPQRWERYRNLLDKK